MVIEKNMRLCSLAKLLRSPDTLCVRSQRQSSKANANILRENKYNSRLG